MYMHAFLSERGECPAVADVAVATIFCGLSRRDLRKLGCFLVWPASTLQTPTNQII